jgi:acetoin utilization protein AcuC
MSRRVQLVRYGAGVPLYEHGGGHPMRPERFLLTEGLIDAYGMLDGERVAAAASREATVEELLLVHSARYVEAVRRAGRDGRGLWEMGFGPPDNPVFPHMHEAAARVAGGTLVAAEAVLSGQVEHAFNPAGGLHHAMPAKASGFCVYDDPAVAIAWLLARGVERVAYVDVDVHHGDGPQAVFYADPRVLTISLHQDGRTLFPGTGAVDEVGEGDARGTSVNVPLPPLTGDDDWLRAFEEVVPPLVEAFRPAVLVTQLGCDSHHSDPLANLLLTTSAYRRAGAVLHDLAHRVCDGRWLATGGGGYQWARVVPRAWTTYFAEMAAVDLPDELPAAWVDHARAEAGEDVPTLLADPPAAGGAVGDPEAVRRTVDRVKELVFGIHGVG